MIYLDNNATTRIDPRVLEAMLMACSFDVANPSSLHRFGQKAKNMLTQASRTIASHFKIKPQEILFASGATEALNATIRGIFEPHIKGHIITSSLEHISVLAVVQWLEKRGCRATFLDPKPLKGAIEPWQIEEAIAPDTKLIVLSAANNETGVLLEMASLAKIARERGIALIVDGVALLGKESFTLPEGVSSICFSGHKIHAPPGIGFAIVRKGTAFEPLIVGGPQQYGRRGGSENLAGIVALSKAIALLDKELPKATESMCYLRDRLEAGLRQNLPDLVIHGEREQRVCNTSNIAFLGVDGETLLMSLDLAGLAVSHGAACSSGALEPSRVLLKMGIAESIVRSSLRFSLSRFTTENEIDEAIRIVAEVVGRLRSFTKNLF